MVLTEYMLLRIYDPDALTRKLKRKKKDELVDMIEYMIDKYVINISTRSKR